MDREAPISYVALDAMGVLYRQRGVSSLLVSFAASMGVAADAGVARDLYRRASRGLLSSAELWQALGIPGPDRDAEFLEHRAVMPGARDFLAAMHAEGIPVGCITNDLAEWSRWLRRTHGLEDAIGPWVVSGEVGVRKPDAAIFQRFLAEAGCEAAECIFVDDTPENLDGARRLGFRTQLFSGFDDVRNLITQLHTVA
ncbi:MAG TPA: HAD-IA family hydrolase [Actinomycetota bacterium]|nr:HAD-IA family hydrolase [Actinomycetota bacterium]